MRTLSVVKTLGRLAACWYRDAADCRAPCQLSPQEQVCLQQITEAGICIQYDFLTAECCDHLREAVDRLVRDNPSTLWTDPLKSDQRLFGADKLSSSIADFFYSPFTTRIAATYLRATTITGYTMANRVRFKSGNQGSGQGWHRDNAGLRSIKAIVYLCDVDANNGPFQYWRSSHRIGSRVRAIWNYGAEWAQKRFTEETLVREIERQRDLITATGTKGTLILTDTTGIHRGRPLLGGSRYALTNYIWKDASQISPQMIRVAHGRGPTTIDLSVDAQIV